MAESKKRKKVAYVPPRRAGRDEKNPVWLVPAITTTSVIGVLWILVYYIFGSNHPLNIGYSNVLVGLGFVVVAFFLMTRWK